MARLEILVEEPSMAEFLRIILPHLLPGYQETSAARNIAPHIRIDNNRSESFRQFITGFKRFIHTIN